MWAGLLQTPQQKNKNKRWVKIPRDQIETIHGVVASTPSIVACMRHDKAKLFASNISIEKVAKAVGKTANDDVVESELWTRFAKEVWQQWRRYGIAIWDAVWSPRWKRTLPVCYDINTMRTVALYDHPKTRERQWYLVDSRGKTLPSSAAVIEWQAPEADGNLTSDMAMLILAVLTHDMRRVQANRAVAEAARTPVVFESQMITDKVVRDTNTSQLGLVPIDAADAMTQSREYPQNSLDATLRLRDILVGVDAPAAPVSIDLLATGAENEQPLRATWLVKPGFHLVPQPFAPPFVPDMKQATEMLENEVSQIMGVDRIFWSSGAVSSAVEASERLARERCEMRQREMHLFLMRHLENIYLSIHNQREAFSLTLAGSQSHLTMPPSLTIPQLEMLREHKILTGSEMREHMCDLFGLTMSTEAKREAKEADDAATRAQNALGVAGASGQGLKAGVANAAKTKADAKAVAADAASTNDGAEDKSKEKTKKKKRKRKDGDKDDTGDEKRRKKDAANVTMSK
jgi:hypothetical protein